MNTDEAPLFLSDRFFGFPVIAVRCGTHIAILTDGKAIALDREAAIELRDWITGVIEAKEKE